VKSTIIDNPNEPFDLKINRLTSELYEMFDRGKVLEAEIKSRLSKLDLTSCKIPEIKTEVIEKEKEIMKIEQDILTIIARSRIEGNVLYLPPERLDRKVYEQVNMVLTQIGGKWNRKTGGHVFENDPADLIDEIMLTGKVIDKKKEFQFFPTPLKLAKEICEMAEITNQCDCLEPSAGSGAIANVIKEYLPKSLTVIELDESNMRHLKEFNPLIGQDFLTWKTNRRFDKIVMNPPFCKKQDIKHIMKAWELLRPKGTLVSILSPSPFYCDDKLSKDFRNFLNENNAVIKDFDEGEFKESGTTIRIKCIKITKAA